MTDTPSFERHRFAEALVIEHVFGERADDYVIDRITALKAAGDEAGVRRWLEIAGRLDQLQRPRAVV